MNTITSPYNPEIKTVVQLHDATERKKQNKCIVEGSRAISTFITHNHKLIVLYSTEKMLTHARKLIPYRHQQEQCIKLVSDRVMHKIASTVSPSGLLAVFEIPAALKAEFVPVTLVLAQINDPGNMGTLIRTAAALTIKTVIIIEGADPWSPKVIAASAGTIAAVTVLQLNWQKLMLLSKQHKLQLCALTPRGGKLPQELIVNRTALVVGNEAHGLPPAWEQDCHERFTLPMPGGIESLNAAVSGSIALYLSIMPSLCTTNH